MKVRIIKTGCDHRTGLDQLAQAGDVIEVSEAEMASFGDKFELVEPEIREPDPEPETADEPEPEVEAEAGSKTKVPVRAKPRSRTRSKAGG